MAQKAKENFQIIAQNKKAFFSYEILEKFEAGMVLMGSEVKSLREGRANLKDSYARIRRSEVFLYGMHISPYFNATINNHEPERIRKLLLHGREIKRLVGKTQEKGLTLVPLRIYFREGKAKLELGLAKGKTLYDKRDSLKRKQEQRDMARIRKNYNK